MPNRLARRAELARIMSAVLGLVLLANCDTPLIPNTPLPQPGSKPEVTWQQPVSGTSVAVEDSVPVQGVAEDASGILRVDLLVNGLVVDSQSLFVASTRFQYSGVWRPTAGGQTTLTLIAYNVGGGASDPVSVTLNVSGQTATATTKAVTPTTTPFVVYVTVTSSPTPRIVTPAITVVTTTPLPTQTPRPTGIPVNTVAPTATISQTATITLTPQ